jgi:hypothetical protein
MPDMGWSDHIRRQEDAAWYESLEVFETRDEFNEPRFFIQDDTGDIIPDSDVYPTRELAQDEIDRIREESKS